VDDSPTVILALRQALHAAKGKAARIEEARDPAQALALLDKLQPDVVFLDLIMPDPSADAAEEDEADDPPSTGLRLMRDITLRRPETRVVLTTGLPPNHPDVIEAVSLGAIGLLRKPVRPDDVRALLDTLEPSADALSYFG